MCPQQQKAVCLSHGSDYLPSGPEQVVGIARSALDLTMPLNGLRHPPEGQGCGWFLWGGEEFSDDPEFFQPLHVSHLAERLPLVLPYLGLAPGWRFLVTPSYEDVWFDAALLKV